VAFHESVSGLVSNQTGVEKGVDKYMRINEKTRVSASTSSQK
jgi:hypothetical protein